MRWEWTNSYTRRDFPTPGLADYRHHLPLAGARLLQGLHQGRELGITADKAGEPARRGRLQAPPDATGTDQLKDLHRRVEPFDGHWSERR